MLKLDHLTPEYIEGLSFEEKKALLADIEALERKQATNQLARFQPYKKQYEFYEAGKHHRERLLLAANRVGKALRNGTPVATPNGWKAIESLREGDWIFAGDGTVTRVTGVFPQGVKALYRVTFDSGQSIDCCGEHLWKIKAPRARFPMRRSHGKTEPNPFFGEWTVCSTEDILSAYGPKPKPLRRAVTPEAGAWQFPNKPLPLDPYVLGALLGDGMLHSNRVMLSSADADLIEEVARRLPDGATIGHVAKYDYAITSGAAKSDPKTGRRVATNIVKGILESLGVYGCGADEKFIPLQYLLHANRIELLRGLMDTDGCVSQKNNVCEFSTVSPDLAHGVVFLAQSLGGKAVMSKRVNSYTYKGERRRGRVNYRVRIKVRECPFRLARKAEAWHEPIFLERAIYSIEPVGPGQATCIAVDHPDRTYITRHGIVTHNTYSGSFEVAYHLTGKYPDWWPGRRFDRPVRVWAGSDTSETTRDTVQQNLVGPPADPSSWGTAAIPLEDILDTSRRQGIADALDTVTVRHISGGTSLLGFKSYDQGRRKWQGTTKDVIWLDEECPEDIYFEALTRTNDVEDGILMLTFTPLNGWSTVVSRFLDDLPENNSNEDSE